MIICVQNQIWSKCKHDILRKSMHIKDDSVRIEKHFICLDSYSIFYPVSAKFNQLWFNNLMRTCFVEGKAVLLCIVHHNAFKLYRECHLIRWSSSLLYQKIFVCFTILTRFLFVPSVMGTRMTPFLPLEIVPRTILLMGNLHDWILKNLLHMSYVFGLPGKWSLFCLIWNLEEPKLIYHQRKTPRYIIPVIIIKLVTFNAWEFHLAQSCILASRGCQIQAVVLAPLLLMGCNINVDPSYVTKSFPTGWREHGETHKTLGG